MGVDPADLASLTVDEKLALISNLWDSIEASRSIPALSPVLEAELSRRCAQGLTDPATTIDWAQVREELFKNR